MRLPERAWLLAVHHDADPTHAHRPRSWRIAGSDGMLAGRVVDLCGPADPAARGGDRLRRGPFRFEDRTGEPLARLCQGEDPLAFALCDSAGGPLGALVVTVPIGGGGAQTTIREGTGDETGAWAVYRTDPGLPRTGRAATPAGAVVARRTTPRPRVRARSRLRRASPDVADALWTDPRLPPVRRLLLLAAAIASETTADPRSGPSPLWDDGPDGG